MTDTPPSKSRRKREGHVQLWLDPADLERIRVLAEDDYRTIQNYIERILKMHLARVKK